MGVRTMVKGVWQRLAGVEAAAGDAANGREEDGDASLDSEPL